MANSDYIGHYGPMIRAKYAQATQPDPQAAFTDMPPQAPAFGDQNGSVTPTSPAFQEARKPLSAKALYEQMPPEHKKELLSQIEKSGTDVNHLFQSHVDSGDIQISDQDVRKPLTKEQKLGYITEVAMRTLSNMNRPGPQGIGAWADASLETDQRRGALQQQADAENRRSQGEKEQQANIDRRQQNLLDRQDRSDFNRENRADARQAVSDTRLDTRLAAQQTEGAADRASREKIAGMEGRAGRNSSVIGEDGILRWVDSNGKARKVTETVDGKDVPVKIPPKFNTGGIDQDTIARIAGKQAETMMKDRKLVNKLKAQGLGQDEIYKKVNDMAFADVAGRFGGQPPATGVPDSAPDPAKSGTIDRTGGQLPPGLPQGAVQIGTSGGKPVYQSPDGKKFTME